MRPPLSRRRFLAALAATVPVAVVVRRAHTAAVRHVAADPRTLDALADVVLPSELGDRGIKAEAAAFREWGAGYREGAELVHGYGTSRLRVTGPTPLTRWSAQLDDLDRAARDRYQRPFHEIPLAQRTDLVRAAISTLSNANHTTDPNGRPGDRPGDRMPTVTGATHVALAMLAHFYDSSAATDLCYNAHIGRSTCRPLAAQARKPLPLIRIMDR